MSEPLNPLSKFRSVRYYHVLAVCDRISTAERLLEVDDETIWDRSAVFDTLGDQKLGKWSPSIIDTADGSDGYFSILIHGAMDADLVITNYKITSFTAASVTSADKNTSIATEGELSISEPKGVVLFDALINIMRSMKSDAATCCFVLKTFFVGYATDDAQGDYVDVIGNITPVMFFLTDATATYSEEGGVYNLQFVSIANGASRLPQYARAADGVSVHLGELGSNRVSVKTALGRLFDVIKTNYQQHYDCVISVAKNKGIENPESVYYPVEYEIEVDDDYADPKYFISDAPMQYKIGGNDCFEPPSFKNFTGASIEDAIHRIIAMCPQIKKDMVDGVGEGDNAIKYEYKVKTSIRTYYKGDKKACTVKYAVKRFLSPRGFNIQKLLEGTNSQDTVAVNLRENLITFDYIFSGKNIDILEFDLKMNYGLAFLQTGTTANSFKDQTEVVASRSTHVSSFNDQTGTLGEILPTPVFFSPQIKSLMAVNTQQPADSVQAAYSMAKHASLEVAEATVKIIGNPNLYSSMADNTRPESVKANTSAPTEAETTPTEDRTADYKNWSNMPALAKINIYMPSHNDDVALLMGTTGDSRDSPPDYTRKFWYDGYYYVYGIEHSFAEGEFTQVLMMVALPNGSLLETGKLDSESEKTVKSITDCYDSKSAIRSNPNTPPPNVAFTPADPPSQVKEAPKDANSGVSVTNRPDAETLNSAPGGSPADVKGWDKATPAVQNAILNAAKSTGVDAKLLAQFAYIESSFRADAKAGTSTATGLYQHLNGTWMDLVRRGSIKTIPSNTPKEAALPKRTDPESSALGGAAYIQLNAAAIKSSKAGDLYLAHFSGPGVAKKIVAACNSGRGGDSLESVLGASQIGKMRSANKFLNDISTAEGLRSWAAKKMANSLKNGITASDSDRNVPSIKGSQKTPTATAPVSQTPRIQQTAGDAAAQNNGNPAATGDQQKKECGTKTPPSTDQQGKTVAGQPSAKPGTQPELATNGD